MSQARGKGLELAILRASRSIYKPTKRGMLFRQVSNSAAGDAPIDFIGSANDRDRPRPFAVECKETQGQSLELRNLDGNASALDDAMACGFDCRIAIDFTAVGEVYLLDWLHVSLFIEAPYRKSLSLAWCRAMGLLLPEENRDSEKTRRVLWLDGKEHVDRAYCQEQIDEERATKPVIALDGPEPDDEPKPPTKSEYGSMTPEEYRARIRDAVAEGTKNAARREKARNARRPVWARRKLG